MYSKASVISSVRIGQILLASSCIALSVVTLNAFGEECNDHSIGKRECRQGAERECQKSFSPLDHKFIYSWEYVNTLGQVFKVDERLFGKTAGYSPKKCEGVFK